MITGKALLPMCADGGTVIFAHGAVGDCTLTVHEATRDKLLQRGEGSAAEFTVVHGRLALPHGIVGGTGAKSYVYRANVLWDVDLTPYRTLRAVCYTAESAAAAFSSDCHIALLDNRTAPTVRSAMNAERQLAATGSDGWRTYTLDIDDVTGQVNILLCGSDIGGVGALCGVAALILEK